MKGDVIQNLPSPFGRVISYYRDPLMTGSEFLPLCKVGYDTMT